MWKVKAMKNCFQCFRWKYLKSSISNHVKLILNYIIDDSIDFEIKYFCFISKIFLFLHNQTISIKKIMKWMI